MNDEGDFCPRFQAAMELVGKRWSGTILRSLLAGPRRFSEISATIPDISDRSLSVRLKEFEAESLVERRVGDTQPVTVTYLLTAKGSDLEAAIAAVEAWAHEWMPAPAEDRNRTPA